MFSVERRLSPGIHRVSVLLKASQVNHINTAPLWWTLTIADARGQILGSRKFSIQNIERAGVYQEFSCNFSLSSPAAVRCNLAWERVAVGKTVSTEVRVEKKDIPVSPDLDMLDDAPPAFDGLDLDVMLEDEPPIAGLKYLYSAAAGFQVEQVSDIAVEGLEVDKIRYNPGEQAVIKLTIRNYSALPRSVTVDTVLINDMDTVIPVDSRDVTIERNSRLPLELKGPAFADRWGYAVRCLVREGDKLLAEGAEYFTVHDNFWAVAINGSGPRQFTGNITDREIAAAGAERIKQRYCNWVESGFWAPDEFGDFTPDTELWWGGQGCYYGGVTGTKLMIEEGGKRGISYVLYSNIWGGDGPPAFELLRKHPDWGHPSTFNTDWFERWDLNISGSGKPGMALRVWPITIINYGLEEPFKHHASELVGAHRMMGWDGVRYDSHAISPGNARVMDIVKKTVREELPGFRFGYNSSVPQGARISDEIMEAFRAECEGEGLIMEEGIRQFGGGGLSFGGNVPYEKWARRLLDFKEMARRNGGHFLAIGLDECFPNDALYMRLLWLAGNTHPCYDWGEPSCVGDHIQFATRFAGQLWDLNVAPLRTPEKWVDFGGFETNLWLWKDFVHQRDMGDGRRQLILHMINAPAAEHLMGVPDNSLPPPRENIRVAAKLPGSPKVRGVWLATPDGVLTQESLKFERAGDTVSFTVPRLRFWDMIVVDLEGADEFAE